MADELKWIENYKGPIQPPEGICTDRVPDNGGTVDSGAPASSHSATEPTRCTTNANAVGDDNITRLTAICDNRNEPLTRELIMEYLCNRDAYGDGNQLDLPPVHPQTGQIYIYRASSFISRDNYLADLTDGGGWDCKKSNLKYIKMTRKVGDIDQEITIKKKFFYSRGNLKKVVYHILDEPLFCLIHYMGVDSTTGEAKPHGNRIHGDRPHVRVAPVVNRNIRAAANSGSTPIECYQHGVARNVPPAYNKTLRPRNPKQAENAALVERYLHKVHTDSLISLFEIGIELEGAFIHSMNLIPDTRIVMGSRFLIDHASTLLNVNDADETFTLHTDTCFSLGDLYLTPVTFRNIFFEGCPIMPLFYLIHSQKHEPSHDDFWNVIIRLLPNLNEKYSQAILIVMERENAIEKNAHNLKLICCWNHIQQDIKHWLEQSV